MLYDAIISVSNKKYILCIWWKIYSKGIRRKGKKERKRKYKIKEKTSRLPNKHHQQNYKRNQYNRLQKKLYVYGKSGGEWATQVYIVWCRRRKALPFFISQNKTKMPFCNNDKGESSPKKSNPSSKPTSNFFDHKNKTSLVIDCLLYIV